MTKEQRLVFQALIDSRLEVGLGRLEGNPAYQRQCRELEEREAAADKILDGLEKGERLTLHRYWESEAAKASLELDGAYIQGLRDCAGLLHFLEVLGQN